MKTTIATINLYLRTAKKLADGTYAIYLRCNFHGMYEVPTHYSVLEKYWDKKNQIVKKGCPNYAMINIEIQKLKTRAIKRRDDFIKNECPYTPKMVLQQAMPNSLKKVMKEIVEEDFSLSIEIHPYETTTSGYTIINLSPYELGKALNP